MRHEVLSLDDMLNQFNLDKVGKSGAKFAIEKLEFFNSMHIRDKFDYTAGNEVEAVECVKEWRKMLLEEMPEELHRAIKRMPNHLLLRIMDMMKIRMRYLRDIRNHSYFFTDANYDTELGRKFIVRLKQPALVNKQILSDLSLLMEKIPDDNFTALEMNKACSYYLH